MHAGGHIHDSNINEGEDDHHVGMMLVLSSPVQTRLEFPDLVLSVCTSMKTGGAMDENNQPRRPYYGRGAVDPAQRRLSRVSKRRCWLVEQALGACMHGSCDRLAAQNLADWSVVHEIGAHHPGRERARSLVLRRPPSCRVDEETERDTESPHQIQFPSPFTKPTSLPEP